MLDISVSYNRFKFLGHEFLTWLWFETEKDPSHLSELTSNAATVRVGNRMVLENVKDGQNEKIIISGEDANLAEGRLAIEKGAVVTEMQIVFTTGEEEWKLNLKGESFHVSGLRLPVPKVVLTSEETEGAVLEKAYFLEKFFELFDQIYGGFLKIRLSNSWEAEMLPKFREWVKQDT